MLVTEMDNNSPQILHNGMNNTLIFTMNFYRKIIKTVISVKIINFLISELLSIEDHSSCFPQLGTCITQLDLCSLLPLYVVLGVQGHYRQTCEILQSWPRV